MKNQTKMILGVVGLVILFGGATIAYRILSKDAERADLVSQTANSPSQDETNQTETQQPIMAPDFSVQNPEGKTVKLSDYFGKPIVLNFWASWCPPCKEEIPYFEKVYKEMGSEIQFLMVDLVDGRRETVEKGKAFIAESQYTFPVLFDTTQSAAYGYGIRSIPTTLFINSDGTIETGVEGAINEQILRQGINLLLK